MPDDASVALTDAEDAPPPFRWRSEAPWVVIPVAIALATRAWAIVPGVPWFNSDTAIFTLLSRHVSRGADWPVFCYGQRYIGTLWAWVLAPFHGAFPGDPRVIALGYAVLYAGVVLPLVYRVCHSIGGRVGALAATGLLAIGTRTLFADTSGQCIGYVELLATGALAMVVAPAYIARPTGARAFAFGLVAGVGMWLHPACLQFLLPVGVALLARGRLASSRESGRLRVELGTRALGLLAVVVLAAVVTAGWALASAGAAEGDGLLSPGLALTKPDDKLRRAAVAVAIAVSSAELVLARSRRRWLGGAFAFGAGAVIGHGPVLLAALGDAAPEGVRAPMFVTESGIPDNAVELAGALGELLIGSGVDASPAPVPLVASRWSLAAVLALAAAVALWRCRHELGRLMAGRAVALSIPSLLTMQSVLLVALWLVHAGGGVPRYLIGLVLPTGALLAATAARLRARPCALAALVVLVGATWGADVFPWIHGRTPADRGFAERALVDRLEAEGVRAGYAWYWTAVKVTAIADERVILACTTGVGLMRFPQHARIADRDLAPVFVFDLTNDGERALAADFARLHACDANGPCGVAVAEFDVAHYHVLRTRRTRPMPYRQ